MFPNDIYLKSTTTGTARKFVLTNVAGADKTRTFEDSVPGLPETIAIKHQVRGKAASRNLAHLVQYQKIKVDSFGAQKGMKIGLTIEHAEGAYTTGELEIALEEFVSFLVTLQANLSTAASITAGAVDVSTIRDLALGAS